MLFESKDRCLTFAHEAARAIVLQINDKEYSVAYRCVMVKGSQHT
jgi:nitroimidazol reductase NimA-like FMN-containing flavoprotein (pyridoxamine 5'-phosphate oxidase superfamily)